MEQSEVLIIGGGPAGLAVAACLKRKQIDAVVLEKGAQPGSAWHHHYERLHLHTTAKSSGLPHRPMPSAYPKYPSRDQVADYLVDYSAEENLDIRTGVEVENCHRAGGRWEVSTTDDLVFRSENVVIATGLSHTPSTPDLAGIDRFDGSVMHSADFSNGSSFRDKRVLVVGFGNSGGEIALDLLEHGAEVDISVRTPSVAIPRDILGVPILAVSRVLTPLPTSVADALSAPLLAVMIGDFSKYGIPKSEHGPFAQMKATQKVPLLDVGTISALKSGQLGGRPGINHVTATGVVFSDGQSCDYDAIVFATGFRCAVADILEDADGLLDERGRPLISGGDTGVEGLYFCGMHEPTTGRLREIRLEAPRIAGLIEERMGADPAVS